MGIQVGTSTKKVKAKGGNICPLCYINGLLLLIFGSSAIAFVQNPWTIAVAVITTILAIYYMYQGYKKNKGKGGLQRNLTTTFLVIAAFMFGYLLAAYQTHDYFEEKYRNYDPNIGCETCSADVILDDNRSVMSDNSASESEEMYNDMMERIKNLTQGVENIQKNLETEQ